MREWPEPPFLSPEDVAWCWSHYLADAADGESPLASPLRARYLLGLPPALVITAELDPLRDEGELYAAGLREAGVAAELVRVDGMVHGFFSLSDKLDAAGEAQALAASALRMAFEAARAGARI
jgi:acetyl esterase